VSLSLFSGSTKEKTESEGPTIIKAIISKAIISKAKIRKPTIIKPEFKGKKAAYYQTLLKTPCSMHHRNICSTS